VYEKKIKGISAGYRSLDEEVEECELQLAWVKMVVANRAPLDSISDIVTLGCLWAHRLSHEAGKMSVLRLDYAGEAATHKEAAADLGRIMEALNCRELKLRVLGAWWWGERTTGSSHGTSRPSGEYRGEGALDNIPLEIRLQCRWLPEGCTVHSEERGRTWSTHRSYSVYCNRR
jgi:hypothetical protein